MAVLQVLKFSVVNEWNYLFMSTYLFVVVSPGSARFIILLTKYPGKSCVPREKNRDVNRKTYNSKINLHKKNLVFILKKVYYAGWCVDLPGPAAAGHHHHAGTRALCLRRRSSFLFGFYMEEADPGSQTHIFESLMTIFWVKSSIILCKLAQIFFFASSKIK